MNPTHTQTLENEVVSPQKSQGLKILRKFNLLWRNAVGSAQLICCIWSEFNDGVLVPVSVARRLWARSGLSSAWPGPDTGPCSLLTLGWKNSPRQQILTNTARRQRHATHNTHTTQINNAYKHFMTLHFKATFSFCVILIKLFHLSQSWPIKEMVWSLTFVLVRGEDEASVECGCQFSLFFFTIHYFCVTKITVHSLCFSSLIESLSIFQFHSVNKILWFI